MTDRMALLERVAEAARGWWNAKTPDAGQKYYAALGDALYALPAEPVGEMVEVAIYANPDGDMGLAVAGNPKDHRCRHSFEYRLVGVATIPTVAAKESEG